MSHPLCGLVSRLAPAPGYGHENGEHTNFCGRAPTEVTTLRIRSIDGSSAQRWREARVFLALPLSAALVVSGFLAAGAIAQHSPATGCAANGHTIALCRTKLGWVLVNSKGHTLYLFTRDKHGKSRCSRRCAKFWPRLLKHGRLRLGPGVKRSLLGTTRRRNGRRQVTYNKHPLYAYKRDTRAGQTSGEERTAFRGRWYAVSAGGKAVKPGGTTTTTTTTTPPPPGPCGSKATQRSTIKKVLWILMENKDYAAVYGASAAPYETRIADECGLATNYHAVSHPSLPNYIALTSGSTQGITDDSDPSAHPLDVKTIYSQTYPSAKGYAESMPSNCDMYGGGDYAVRHNPWTYYVNGSAGSQRTECQAKDVPYSSPTSGALYNDVHAGALPAFGFVTPNLCNDMHDCSVGTGDAYLKRLVPMILGGPDYRNGKLAVVVVFDENGGASGNQVYVAVISPFTRAGTKVGTSFTHYSLLRTTEEILGKSLLGNAASAASMRAAFGL